MAATVILEAAAAAAQYTDTTRDALKTTLTANIAVLLAGTGGEAVTDVHVGTWRKAALYPVIYILHTTTQDGDSEFGARELRQSFRIYVYQRGALNDGTLEQQVVDLADRVREVLHSNRNRQADSLWYDLQCQRLVSVGMRDAQLRGAHIDVVVSRMVDQV